MADEAVHRFSARRLIVLWVMGLATVALLWRAVDLQLTHKEFLQREGDARHLRVISIPAHRGILTDRNGEALAISTPVNSVWMNPRELLPQHDRWSELTHLLELDEQRFQQLVENRGDREFVYLRRHVDPGLATQVSELHMPGVYLQHEYRRYYPAGEVAAHIVGFTNVDDRGQEGMELALDEWLRGVNGSKRVIRDRLGRIVEDVESIQSPRAGETMPLSIDLRIQYLTYRALKRAVERNRARGGSAVILDAQSGEVLAAVNQPSYNPNNRPNRMSGRYRNRVVTDVFEPGSTIKPFTIASALQTGQFDPSSLIDTAPGLLRIGRHTVRDLRDYGVLDLESVLKKSSNVGASKLALAIPPEALWETYSRLGFGAMTGSGFPGDSLGSLSHFADWGDIHRATLAFGYGLSVTSLQLAQAYTVFANDGKLRPVTFVRIDAPPEGRSVLSPATAVQVRSMLESVVSEGGTGRRAQISGYRVAGKTGTIRKASAGGYSRTRYMAMFAGMVPASAPRFIMVVVVDEPSTNEYYGGQVAAPVFAQVMGDTLRLMGVPPDDPDVLQRRVAHNDDPRVVTASMARAAQ